MAKATTHIEKTVPQPAAEQAQAIQQLLQAVTEKRDALLVFLDILQELHQIGVLEALQSLLKNRHDIGVIGITQLNKPGAQRMLKNGMNALQFLSGIEPAELKTLLDGVAGGVKAVAEHEPDQQTVGMWSMVKSMRDPEVGTSLGMMLHFLRGMGTELRKDLHGTGGGNG